MAHWEDRESWLHGLSTDQSELWHGERFQELSSFWNPDETSLLPEFCTQCNAILTSDLISAALDNHHNSSLSFVEVVCPACTAMVKVSLQYMQGDPRNQAVIIHEDGWAPHSTSAKHSVAAITITHACMTKLEISKGTNARVFAFIPVSQLPTKAPHKFDAFFEPLIDELEMLFVDGQQVLFKSAVESFSPADDTPTLRVLPLLLTADMKAHAEIGLTSAGGRKGCRRCEVVGEYFSASRHYYYGNFLYRHRFRPELRTARSNLESGIQVDNASSQAERAALVKQSGVTGVSPFYRLRGLCEFDPVHDMVVDTMHAISLNLIRTELDHLLADLGPNKDIGMENRDPRKGGLLDRKDLVSALSCVPWTAELKDGRVPSVGTGDSTSKHHLGYWKCEEFSKFILVAPFVLNRLIPKRAYDCFCLLHRVHQLVFSKRMRILGWKADDRQLLEDLLWLHAIWFEELYGTSACTENLECTLHLPDDIRKFSSPDNYWCFVYERMVRFYKTQTTNQKSLCKTFADRAQQLDFVESYLETHSCDAVPLQSTAKFQSSLEKPVVLAEKTVDSGIALKEHIVQQYTSMPDYVKSQYQSGILLGAPQFTTLTQSQISDIKFWVQQSLGFTPDTLPFTAQSFSRLLKSDDMHMATTYRVGEVIVIKDSVDSDKEWVVKITNFLLYGPIARQYLVLLDGSYYAAKVVRGQAVVDSWTNLPLMVPKLYHRLCLQPTSLVSRKVMLYPDPAHRQSPSSFLVIDPDSIDFSSVAVPFYPQPGEVVEAYTSGKTLTVLVSDINRNSRTARGKLLKKVSGPHPRWTSTQRVIDVPLMDIIKRVELRCSGSWYYKQ